MPGTITGSRKELVSLLGFRDLSLGLAHSFWIGWDSCLWELRVLSHAASTMWALDDFV